MDFICVPFDATLVVVDFVGVPAAGVAGFAGVVAAGVAGFAGVVAPVVGGALCGVDILLCGDPSDRVEKYKCTVSRLLSVSHTPGILT